MEKKKCQRCKKMLPEDDFNEVDYGYGVYRKLDWCKVCCAERAKEKAEEDKKWLAFQEKYQAERRAKGIPRMKGWNHVGCKAESRLPNGKLISPACKGFPITEAWRKKEAKKLAYPFGWPHK